MRATRATISLFVTLGLDRIAAEHILGMLDQEPFPALCLIGVNVELLGQRRLQTSDQRSSGCVRLLIFPLSGRVEFTPEKMFYSVVAIQR